MPQIGPDVPPIRDEMIMPVFLRKVPVSLRSMSSQLEHLLEAAGQRVAEVAVADDRVQFAEVVLVVDRRLRDRAHDQLGARQ